jgi:hypothetical protein
MRDVSPFLRWRGFLLLQQGGTSARPEKAMAAKSLQQSGFMRAGSNRWRLRPAQLFRS